MKARDHKLGLPAGKCRTTVGEETAKTASGNLKKRFQKVTNNATNLLKTKDRPSEIAVKMPFANPQPSHASAAFRANERALRRGQFDQTWRRKPATLAPPGSWYDICRALREPSGEK
jgi:hypothetical protein